MTTAPELILASDHALLVRFGDEPDAGLNDAVLALFAALRDAPPAGVLDLHPAYASLLVRFDPLATDRDALREDVRARCAALDVTRAAERAVIEVPVDYGGAHGPDLEDVARLCGLSEREVIERHAAPVYRVCFLGFSPGFPYLGGLPAELAVPRLDAPRTRVPAGSVAIGGAQTGIYPSESPGGWRLIGRTVVALLRPGCDPPTLFQPGDRVRFVPRR